MTTANKVEITGTIGRVKSGSGARGVWAFGSIQPKGEPGWFDVSAFDDAAEVLAGIKDGAEVQITGRLMRKQDKRTEAWQTIVRAEEVTAV